MDPARMGDALEPGRVTFDEKMVVRRAIEEAGIPHTYVSANCFAGYFVGNLSQMCVLTPPKEKVCLYGDGNVKGTSYAFCLVNPKNFLYSLRITSIYNIGCNIIYAVVFVDENDVATYTIKTVDDPRALNKTVYIRPPDNILSQREIVEIWEKLTGKELHKFGISKEDFLSSMEGNKLMEVTTSYSVLLLFSLESRKY